MHRTENLDEEMNSFEISKFIVIGIHADTEEQAGVSPVDDLVVPELASRSALVMERSHGGIPRQSSIGTFGPVGRLSGALPRVAGPVVEGSASQMAGVLPGNRDSLSHRRRRVRTIWTAWSCPGDSGNDRQRTGKVQGGRALTCTRMNLIMQEGGEGRRTLLCCVPRSSPATCACEGDW